MLTAVYVLLAALHLQGVVFVDEVPQTQVITLHDRPDVCEPVLVAMDAPLYDRATSRESPGNGQQGRKSAAHTAESHGYVEGQGLGPCILPTNSD